MRTLHALALCAVVGCSSNDKPSAIVDASVDPACPSDWWDCAYENRRTIRVAAPGESLTDFPLLLSLGTEDLIGVEPSGIDLRVVTAEGTELVIEVDTITASEAQLWVRVPTLAAETPTQLHMYWNNPSPGTRPEATVWNDDYKAVWHLNIDNSDGFPDSTGNGNAATPMAGASAPMSVPAAVGSGVDFENTGAWLEVAHSESLDITGETITLSGWALFQAEQADDGGMIVKTDNTDYHYQLGIQEEELANFRVYSDSQSYLTGFSPLQTNRWYYLVGVYDGTTSKIYLNGQLDRSFPHTGSILTTTAPLLIGRRNIEDDRFFDGILDELRVSDVARSAAWIRAEFLNVTGELVTLGDVESL